MFGKRLREWAAGAVIGSSLAVLLFGLGEWRGCVVPRQKQIPPPAIAPIPRSIAPQPSPRSAEPDRNEIRLPLPPAPRETEPIQVQAEPPPPFDPNAIDENGVTALMRAAGQADIDELQRLVDLGAEINQMDRLAHTALFFAIAAKSGPAVEWLLAHGAEVNCNCCDGAQSPLLHALATSELSVIEPILRAERPIQWCRPAREALDEGLKTENKPLVRALLLHHQTAPTLDDDSRQPLLAYAVVSRNYALLALLLECGASPNTPLKSPVEKKFSQQVSSASVRDYLQTESGMTPLMLAAATSQLECAEILLKYGAKRGATTGRYKMTAIDFAARHDAAPEMLQVLLGKSPRPEDQRMHINISIGSQRAVFYKDGQVALVMPVSTGRPGFPTPTGQFVVTDKDRMHRSTLYPAYMPYFLRMSCRDFGMHAGVLPGYPDSHGCIRLPFGSAQRLFREVDIGTLVTISR